MLAQAQSSCWSATSQRCREGGAEHSRTRACAHVRSCSCKLLARKQGTVGRGLSHASRVGSTCDLAGPA